MEVTFGSNGKGSEEYRLVASVASEAMGIGKSSDVLTILGGKASCRRKFVLNVHLVDEHGSLVPRDLAIVASVAYAHDHSPVVRDEKPFLAEPPLFTTFNGVEFPAQDRPTRMVSGRASFKLAISLLSSKCDNRLFCICFTPQMSSGEVASICSPCYSKPIRSISRKRTQSTVHTNPSPPLLLLPGLDSSTTSALGLSSIAGNREGIETEGPKFVSPTCSGENDGVGSPGGRHVRGSSRSSSVTSMHYVPQSSAAVDDGSGSALMLEEILFPDCNGLTAPVPAGIERFRSTDPSASSSGNMANSPAVANFLNKLPCSLSLRLSPSDSGSPTSGALTSDSSFDNKDPTSLSRTQSSPLADSRAPSPLLSGTSRPFRPYATVGPCKIPMTDFQLGSNVLASPQSHSHSFKRQSSTSASSGEGVSASTLLEQVHNLRSLSPATTAVVAGKVDSLLHNFSLGPCSGEEKFNPGLTEISLEEEEKSLQYIEVSLQEVSREVQRRKEELRCKRRRLLEDEARMHCIIFQSSSWIESLSGRFSL